MMTTSGSSRKPLDPKDIEAIKTLHSRGHSAQQIAEQLGVEIWVVKGILEMG